MVGKKPMITCIKAQQRQLRVLGDRKRQQRERQERSREIKMASPGLIGIQSSPAKEAGSFQVGREVWG